jgi:hypothetical protein
MIDVFYRGMSESEIGPVRALLRRIIANLEEDEAGARGAP